LELLEGGCYGKGKYGEKTEKNEIEVFGKFEI